MPADPKDYYVANLSSRAFHLAPFIWYTAERDIPVTGILLLFGWYRYRYQKKLVLKKYRYQYRKICVPVPENSREFGTGTGEYPGIFHFWGGTARYLYQKKMVPEKSNGTGNIWSRKKSTSTGNILSRKKVRPTHSLMKILALLSTICRKCLDIPQNQGGRSCACGAWRKVWTRAKILSPT